MLRKRTPLKIRLWSRILKSGPSDCWIWTGTKRRSGYGCIGKGGYRGGNLLAHRAVYEDVVGPIPPGLVIMHTCDVPLCCNPAHLRMGTHADNVADMISKGRNFNISGWRGENGPGFAKLTPADVRAIRVAPGTLAKIASQYGVGISTIQDVRTRRSWSHVKDEESRPSPQVRTV